MPNGPLQQQPMGQQQPSQPSQPAQTRPSPWDPQKKKSLGDILGINTEFEAQPFDFDPVAFRDPFRAANKQMLAEEIGLARGRTVDQGMQLGARGQQQTLAGILQNQALGQGPSLADMQLREMTDRNLNQALALQASAPGTNPALAARNVANQQAQIGQQMAGQAAQLGIQERMGAAGQLGQVLSGMRGQDIGASGLDLQQQALNDQMVRAFVNAGLSIDEAQFAANQELQRLMAQQHLGAQQLNAGVEAGNAANNRALLGGILGGVGGIIGQAIG